MPGLNADVVDQFRRRFGHHPAVQPGPRPGRRRAGGAGGHQCRRQPAARRPAGPADLQQGQSGRRADPDAGGHRQRRCRCRSLQDLVDTRLAQKISQLPGVGLVSIAGGQRPAVRVTRQSEGACRLWAEPRRPAHGASPTPTSISPRAVSTDRRAPPPSMPTTSSQSADEYAPAHHRLPEWRARAPEGRGRRRRRRREPAPGRLGRRSRRR